LTQARWVAERLGGAELVEVSSDGEPGDKSRFVRGVERVLLDGGAELGVHSAKDLPGEMPPGLEIAAVPEREEPADVWIGAGESLDEAPEGARALPTFSLELLWLVTRRSRLSDPGSRHEVQSSLADLGGLPSFVPRSMPGAATVLPQGSTATVVSPLPLRLTLAYTEEDARAPTIALKVREVLAQDGIETTLKAVGTLRELLQLAGPPAKPGIDLVLLGWSAEFFDAYNILDLFPCGSAFNVAQWCDRDYDRLMAQAVRTLDDEDRWRIERRLVTLLDRAVPAIPVAAPAQHVFLEPGVRGFRWSPIGFYELMGMTRS